MTANQDDSERRWRRAIRGAYAPGAGCPTPESWHRAATGELAAEERMRLAAHAAGCPACAAERDLAALFAGEPEPAAAADVRDDLADIVARLEASPPHRPAAAPPERPASQAAAEAPQPTPAADAASGRSGGRLLRFPPRGGALAAALAAAAALALAVGLGLRSTAPPPLPDRPPADAIRGGAVTGLAPEGELEAPPAAFDWTPVEDAAGYRLTVFAADDAVLWQGEVTAPPAPPPAAVMPLSSAVRYQWRVEALDAEGGTVARSERIGFRIRPRAEPIPPPGDERER